MEETGLPPLSAGRPQRQYPSMGYIARATATILVVLVLFAAAWQVRSVLMLVLGALVLAFGMEPTVRWLSERGVRRGIATAVIFLAALGALVAFFALFVPPLVEQGQELFTSLPEEIQQRAAVDDQIGRLLRDYAVADRVAGFLDALPGLVAEEIPTILGVLGVIFGGLFGTITVGALTVFFVLALPRIRSALQAMADTPQRAGAVGDALDRIGGYVNGNVIISVIAGLLSLAFMLIAGIPYAAPLALWVAFTDLIPTVGAFLGAIPVVIIALFESPVLALVAIVYFVAYQQLENFVIQPRVMSKAIDLTAAGVLIAVLIGSNLAGLIGALLALPITAALKVLVRAYSSGRIADAVFESAEPSPSADDQHGTT